MPTPHPHPTAPLPAKPAGPAAESAGPAAENAGPVAENAGPAAENAGLVAEHAGLVAAVSTDGEHNFSKVPRDEVELVEGFGIVGDTHAGTTVQHLFRMQTDPEQPNLRQVHLVASEWHDEVREHGYELRPGDIGENVLTTGIDLIRLPAGTLLRLGADAIVRVTGLRNPCKQIDTFRTGLLRMSVGRDEAGEVVRKVGVMSVVERGGIVRPGDPIDVVLPDGEHVPLAPV